MSSREEELVDEIRGCRLEVLGISEAKLRGNGVKMLHVYIQGSKKVDPRQAWRSGD